MSSHTLSEHESKELLRAAGVDVPHDRLVDDAGAAVRAAEELGFPVALKLCGRKIAHKTERGLVRLGLGSAEAVREAADALLAARRPDDGDARLLVCRMVAGRRELIAGLVRDPQFGPCVMLGLGGIFAEALGDVAFAAAPLARGDAEDLIDALQYKKLLSLGRIGASRPEVRSIDVNPLIVSGDRPVVIDALVELEGEAR